MDTALRNKLLASAFGGFAGAPKLRSTQVGDGSNDLVGLKDTSLIDV
jgi:hypothetical protein